MRGFARLIVALLAATLVGQAPAVADSVGVASAVAQNAKGQVGSGAMRTIRIGKSVFNRERITTDRNGLVQVLLADGSNFVVGPNSSLVIDEFVYRPAEGQGRLVATFGRGVARYVGGKISKNQGGVTINTRQGTIGVRGGMANLVDRGNEAVFSFLYGKDLTFTGRDGRTVRVYRSGFSIFAAGGAGRSARTPKTLQQQITALLSGTRPSGRAPTTAQLQRFSLQNSSLPPVPGAAIPPPVITSFGGPVPGNALDYGHANSSFLDATKTYCGYSCN